MTRATFRFYEELNDFLPENRRKVDFEVRFQGRRLVMDMVEALGVPHPEIDLILANGRSIGFDYIVGDSDRISVYPVFESLNIEKVTRIREVPLRKSRFIAARNLGRIVKYMRLLGFDVTCDPAFSNREIIEISNREKRIILTKSRRLFEFKETTRAILIRPGTPVDQVVRILRYLDIKEQARPFSRCLVCNRLLEPVRKDEVPDRIAPGTGEGSTVYARCRSCDRPYQRGAQYMNMKKAVDRLLEPAVSRLSAEDFDF